MNDIESLIRAINSEIQKSISPRTAMGDPIAIGERIVIPLVSVGMGFGAGLDKDNAGGGGGALGIKPVAVIVADRDWVKVEMLKPSKASAIESLADALPKVAEAMPRGKERHSEDIPTQ